MTKDTSTNLPFTQSNGKNFKARMVLEPIRGIRINLNWESDYTQKYTEYFGYNSATQQYEHRNPLESGSYTYSDINLLSSFKTINNNGTSETETELRRNTVTYATLFRNANPNSTNAAFFDPLTNTVMPDYTMGYGPLQQDVLINSFLVTYRGGSASGGEKNLSPFSRIPLPNWTINYNGLSQIPSLKKFFTSFSLKHGYNSKTTISSFNSEFRYEGGGGVTNPIKIDSLNNNFIPYYYIPTTSISETFNPLFGVEFTLKNSMNFKFEYRSSRQISMSLIDYQLTENKSTGFTIGAGYLAKNFKLPFLNSEGKQIVLEEGVRFSLDVAYSDNFIVNHRLSQGIHTPVGGASRLTINPKIDAVIGKKFNISLFYNYVYNSPKISSSFTTINGAGGVKMSFNLAQ
jgi:cell surface protein SprA